jgi:hypothetical protein
VQPWRLIEDALRPTFAAQDLPPLWERIEMVLRRLPPTGVQRLAARLAAVAEAVPGGGEAAGELLEQLAPFAAEGGPWVAEEEEENEQQQQQQQQQGAATERSAAEEEGEEEAAEAELQGRKKKRRRDKFHSKQSRQEALLQKAAAAAAKGGTSAAAAAAAQRERQAAAPGARFAAWLAAALADLLATPPLPSQLPGVRASAAFCSSASCFALSRHSLCRPVARSFAQLTAARIVAHEAPATHAGSLPPRVSSRPFRRRCLHLLQRGRPGLPDVGATCGEPCVPPANQLCVCSWQAAVVAGCSAGSHRTSAACRPGMLSSPH